MILTQLSPVKNNKKIWISFMLNLFLMLLILIIWLVMKEI